MLSFFRVNDPYRLVGVLLLLLALRVPYWLSDISMTIPQLSWLIAGSRLSEGAMMYDGVWLNLSPFSAGVYWILYFLFGKSLLAHQIVAGILTFIQAVLFNSIMINKSAFNENTYIPAAVFVILSSLYFDFFTLSPALMGLTFILLALNNVFGQIEIRAKRDEKLLITGAFLGIGMLFHFPYFIFGFIVLIIFILFTATVRRRYLLFMFGWLLPQVLVILYYFYNDSFDWYLDNHLLAWFTMDPYQYISNQQTFVIMGFFGVLMIFSLLRIFGRARLTNYQSRLIQAMLLALVLSGVIFIVEVDRKAFVFLTFIPFISFFLSHFFILTKKGVMGNITFLVFILGVGYFSYVSLSGAEKEGPADIRSYFVNETEESIQYKDQRFMWLGDNIHVYKETIVATPFIDWRLSGKAWENLGSYKYQTQIARSIEVDRPEVIIDQQNRLLEFFRKAPALKDRYERDGQIYLLMPSN